jgi:hypothetical protein
METDNSPIEEFRNQFKIKKAPVNSLPAEQRSVKSVILAFVLSSLRIGPESFCIKERFPASGNDKKNKTIISRSRPSKNFLIKISELLNIKFIILIFAFYF